VRRQTETFPEAERAPHALGATVSHWRELLHDEIPHATVTQMSRVKVDVDVPREVDCMAAVRLHSTD